MTRVLHRVFLVLAAPVACLLLVAGAPRTVLAQGGATPKAQSTGDFLLHRPRGAVTFRTGWQLAIAGSDLFDFFQKQLTIERSDFDGVPFGGDVAIVVSRRAQLLFGVDFANASVSSEYRDWVDNNGEPIEQTTSLSKLSLAASVKFALVPRGVQVSRLAWVPRRVVPYVGGGGGAVEYNLEQAGDFVDFEDLGVFSDRFVSEGWAPMLVGFGGVDVRVYRMLFVNLEGRYCWAKADLDEDFVGFDPIDLSGFVIGVGVSWVF